MTLFTCLRESHLPGWGVGEHESLMQITNERKIINGRLIRLKVIFMKEKNTYNKQNYSVQRPEYSVMLERFGINN